MSSKRTAPQLQPPVRGRDDSGTEPIIAPSTLSALALSASSSSTSSISDAEQIIVEDNFLAARTTFSGDFTSVFTYSPIGPVEPTEEHFEWELIGTFRYDDDRRLAEEWVQTDYRSFLTKLGVTTAESA